jgi:hypothetical protein
MKFKLFLLFALLFTCLNVKSEESEGKLAYKDSESAGDNVNENVFINSSPSVMNPTSMQWGYYSGTSGCHITNIGGVWNFTVVISHTGSNTVKFKITGYDSDGVLCFPTVEESVGPATGFTKSYIISGTVNPLDEVWLRPTSSVSGNCIISY